MQLSYHKVIKRHNIFIKLTLLNYCCVCHYYNYKVEIFVNMVRRGGKTDMPAPFRPITFKSAQKRSGAGRANLGVRVQNSSPPVYWRDCGLAGMPGNFFFTI
jgi:hypothetical protein